VSLLAIAAAGKEPLPLLFERYAPAGFTDLGRKPKDDAKSSSMRALHLNLEERSL